MRESYIKNLDPETCVDFMAIPENHYEEQELRLKLRVEDT